jgi:hypothetical protein
MEEVVGGWEEGGVVGVWEEEGRGRGKWGEREGGREVGRGVAGME